MLNFNELEMKYGAPVAYQCLVEIEKAARIPSWTVAGIDCETRLANAIHTQDIARTHGIVNDNYSRA